jgi:peptidoglycan/xylan/chitin deacetylase (PgdA/CDA1 family)
VRLLGLAAAANAAPWLAAFPSASFPFITCRIESLPDAVVLTFDDGPSPTYTPAVLETLGRAGATATFFATGEQAARHPALVREIAAAGHDVGLHGHRHLPHALLPPHVVWRDLARGRAVIEDALGAPICAVRAPFGAVSAATIAFARTQGLVLCGWRRWGRDWQASATPAAVTARVTQHACPGDIVLLHDADTYSAPGSTRATVEAVPTIVTALAARNLRCVSLTCSER